MLNIKLDTEEEINRFILITNIGIMTAIKNDLISIQEADQFFYNPFSYEKIRALGIKEDVIILMELGSELEDVESLIPHKLIDSIDEILNKSMELLKALKSTQQPIKKWFR